MKIVDIKKELGLAVLSLNYTMDQHSGVRSNWLRHWDNEQRFSVNIHEDTLAKAKANKDLVYFWLEERVGH